MKTKVYKKRQKNSRSLIFLLLVIGSATCTLLISLRLTLNFRSSFCYLFDLITCVFSKRLSSRQKLIITSVIIFNSSCCSQFPNLTATIKPFVMNVKVVKFLRSGFLKFQQSQLPMTKFLHFKPSLLKIQRHPVFYTRQVAIIGFTS